MQFLKQVLLDIAEFIFLVLQLLYSYVEGFLVRCILPARRKSLKDQVVLVTGSGRGIGREICIELAKHGARVVCWSRSEKPNRLVAQEIAKLGGTAYAYTVDVSDKKQVQAAAALVHKEVGDVDIVINNAGVMRIKPFVDTEESEIESMFRVNVFSGFWVAQEFLPRMIQKGTGHLVSVCSASGLLATRNLVPYSATKHAVHGYMEGLRDELRYHAQKPKIKITTAFPFYCNTEMLDGATAHTRFPHLIPIMTPEQVAKRVVKGVREEKEYLYIPVLIGWLAMLSWIVPPRTLVGFYKFVECHIDPETEAPNNNIPK